MSKIGFSSNPSNGSLHTWRSRRRFNYNSSKGGWQAKGATPPRPSAPTLNNNTDLQDMNDATGLAAKMRGMAVMYNSYSDLPNEDVYTGTFAYVRDENCLYMWAGESPVEIVLTFLGDKAVYAGGLTAGGSDPVVAYENQMLYFSIATDTTSQDFGDLNENHRSAAAASDGTYLYVVGGTEASGGDYADTGDRVTFATASVATVSGGGIQAAMLGGAGDGTYGYFIGGHPGGLPFRNNISRIDIASGTSMTASYGTLSSPYGNTHGRLHMSATSNIDNLFINGGYYDGSSASPTYGNIDTVDVMSTASGGVATTYGTISTATSSLGAVNDATYTVFYAEQLAGTTDSLQYYNMSTGAGSTVSSFGDLGYNLNGSTTCAGTSDGTTGVFTGSYGSREVKKVTIATTGSAATWGNMHKDLVQMAGGSGS